MKKAQAQAADEALQAQDSKAYSYTVNTSLAAPPADKSEADSSDSAVQVTKDANGDVTINRTWDAKEGTLDTSVSSPDSKTAANIASGGDKITSDDGAYHGEASTTTDTSKSTTSTTSSDTTTTKSSTTTTSTTSSTPSYGDTRVVDGQKQVYTPGFGWVADTSGGESTYMDMPELSGNQVGNMG